MKKRIEKLEKNIPAEPDPNIRYTAHWGNEPEERPGKLIKKIGKNPVTRYWRLEDGTIKKITTYYTNWPEPPAGRAALFDDDQGI